MPPGLQRYRILEHDTPKVTGQAAFGADVKLSGMPMQ